MSLSISVCLCLCLVCLSVRKRHSDRQTDREKQRDRETERNRNRQMYVSDSACLHNYVIPEVKPGTEAIRSRMEPSTVSFDSAAMGRFNWQCLSGNDILKPYTRLGASLGKLRLDKQAVWYRPGKKVSMRLGTILKEAEHFSPN